MVRRLEEEKARFCRLEQPLFDQRYSPRGGQLDDPAGFVRA